FKQSFALTFCMIYALLFIVCIGQYFVEIPASVLHLDLNNYGPRSRRHFSTTVARIRHGFRIFAVVGSLALGYWAATTMTIGTLTPPAIMLFGSMAALAPIAWIYALMGIACPPLRRMMTTRTVYVPRGAN